MEYVLLKRNWISVAAFPILMGIICVLAALVYMIHYPQTVNVRVVFTEINRSGNTIISEIDVPQSNLHDIAVGQSIQLRVADYPYIKFGILMGEIKNIYGATNDNNIKAELFFPDGLKTNRQFTIGFRQYLKADALIITRDMNLLQRIFMRPARSIN